MSGEDGMFTYEERFAPFSRDDVLDADQLADRLGLSVAKVKAADFPCVPFGRDVRYVWGVVVDVLVQRSLNAA